MMALMMTLQIFLKKKQQKQKKTGEKVPEFEGWGRNKGFWPEYLPMVKSLGYIK